MCGTNKCQLDSIPYIPDILIISDDPITINEGDDSQFISIMLTLPPKFICNRTGYSLDKDCALDLTAVITNDNDYSCYDQGGQIPQAVIGYFPMDLKDKYR